MIEYRLIEGGILPRGAGPVVQIQASEYEGETYGPGCIFWCPCLERQIVVRTPPHKSIIYDAWGRPTIKGSIGAEPAPPEFPRGNWCHSYMTAGRFKLTADAVCPGSTGEHAT